MPDLLFLTQRIPYPPFKGEKVRPLHIIEHLRRQYTIHLGCLVDDPADETHIPTVAALCGTSHFARLDRRRAKLACLSGLLTREGLSVTFYRDRGLAKWVRRTLETVRPEIVFVFSSNMAPYVLGRTGGARATICDLADVDSEKWRAYASVGRGPMRWVHAREARKIAALEATIGHAFDWSTFVSTEEASLFQRQHPDLSPKVRAISNGVDHVYFDPALAPARVYPTDRLNFVFTGTMDYPPNIDAVRWFATEILPLIRGQAPDACFHIVGASPAAEVQALADIAGVTVTGRVPDVRPYLAHATAAVAPLRIARGIQNKVLEAMAMARPVVVTPDALEGIAAVPGGEVLLAAGPEEFAAQCLAAAQPGAAVIAKAARRRIEADYGWESRMRGFDDLLQPAQESANLGSRRVDRGTPFPQGREKFGRDG